MTESSGKPHEPGVEELLRREPVVELLRRHAAAHRPGMSADEFLGILRPHVRRSGEAGRAVALEAGLASRTHRELELPWPPAISAVALLAGLVERGVGIDSVEEPAEAGVVITGQVPSSPAHFGGTVTCELWPSTSGCSVSFDVVFPGQAIAWGAGGRLIKASVATAIEVAPLIAAS